MVVDWWLVDLSNNSALVFPYLFLLNQFTRCVFNYFYSAMLNIGQQLLSYSLRPIRSISSLLDTTVDGSVSVDSEKAPRGAKEFEHRHGFPAQASGVIAHASNAWVFLVLSFHAIIQHAWPIVLLKIQIFKNEIPNI